MGIPVVRVEGLTKSYGQTLAVDGIDFTIETGEVVAILGPNGAGKTTTAEMLEGFGDQTRGESRFSGTTRRIETGTGSTGSASFYKRVG